METYKLKTPVVFMIFNRPDTTKVVFEAIRAARPPKLLVIADGPRDDKPGEWYKCEATRQIIDGVDWECEVLKNYSETNLGCARRVSSGLDWVFENVEEAIILEDDCVPHQTFFRFCEELLERYRNDSRIMVVSGNNFQFGRRRNSDSYYFSRYNHCWGWATWKRAWRYFDFEMKLWPEIRDQGWLNDILLDSVSVDYWTQIFEFVYNGCIDSWAYRWTFSCWIQNGLSILPNVNLVSNIGFSDEATHTTGKSTYANMRADSMIFPLRHPLSMIRDHYADNLTQSSLFRMGRFNFAKKAIKKLFRF